MPGSRPADDRGQGPSNNGSGGRGHGAGMPGAEREKKATPPPAEAPPPANPDDVPAPDSGTTLAIRKIQDLIKDDKFTPEVERKLGLTKEEAAELAKKYDASVKPKGAARPGQEIKLKQEKAERKFDPNRQAPEKLPDRAVSSRNDRGGNVVPTDDVHALAEGAQTPVPKALQKRVKAYTESLARSPVTAPSRRPAGASAPAPARNGGTNP